MFGVILKFQAFLERLKKNKGMWFTTITVLSFVGVVATLYYLNTTTSRSAKKFYQATSDAYFHDLDSKITETFEKISILGVTLTENQDFIKTVNDINNVSSVGERLKKTASDVDTLDKGIIIDLYNKNGMKVASSEDNKTLSTFPNDSKAFKKAVATNQFASSIEYEDGGVYICAFFPLQNSVLETKKSIDYLVDEYQQNDKTFQVLLDKDFLNMKNIQSYGFKKVGNAEISVQQVTDDDFLQKIESIDFDEVIKDKYILTSDYFLMAKPIVDNDNKRIGVILISENLLRSNSLPNITHSLSTGITTAAIGLVVSLLVLMV